MFDLSTSTEKESPAKRPYWETLDTARGCDRCERERAAVRLEFKYSGHWNVCHACAEWLVEFHARCEATAA